MYPIRFEPVYQNYIWGGDRIPKIFHRSVPLGRYAESWEVSDREEGMSVIANGVYRGKTLRELCLLLKEKLVGEGRDWKQFPLLIKIIDAKENLSIQVHPDDAMAKQLNGEPKTEMWIALEPSEVYAGLKSDATKAKFLEAIETKRGDHLLEKERLERGEALFIPGGLPHAICAGSFLLEIQQNSNTTYRLYDWGRVGRELHLEKGVQAIHWGEKKREKIKPLFKEGDSHHRTASIVSCPYFLVEELEIFDRWQLTSHLKTCQIIFCMQGEAMIEKELLLPGMTYLIPAAAFSTAIEGKCQLIRITLS